MPFVIDKQPGEEVYIQREFHGSHSHVFAMAVSNQAVYVSAQRFAVRDTWYFKRIPLADVIDVRLVKQKPISLLLLSVAMVVFGALVSFQMMWHGLHLMPGEYYRGSGWPFAITIGGIVIPFISRGRKILLIKTSNGKFKWKPQLAMDKKTRAIYTTLQAELMAACMKAGIRTSE